MRIKTLLTTASAMALSFGVMASGAIAGSNNDLFVEQAGNANFQFADQDAGSSNETYIEQNGNANSAGATFTDPATGTANRNDGLIKQTGNQNVASWAFNNNNSDMRRNDLGIVQDGGGNFANFILTDQGPMNDSTLFVEQSGNGNYASSSQATGGTFAAGNGVSPLSGSVTLADFSVASLEGQQNTSIGGGAAGNSIRGNNNFVGLLQDGGANAMHLTVQGSDNTIGGPGSSLSGSFNNYTGSGGFFDGDTTFASLSGSLAVQNGNGNVGVARVDGVNNNVSWSQTGNDNTAEVYVQGIDNSASVSQ
jgi:hypothetical protein